eukprot:2781028-Prymnesium_polylepis.2
MHWARPRAYQHCDKQTADMNARRMPLASAGQIIGADAAASSRDEERASSPISGHCSTPTDLNYKYK